MLAILDNYLALTSANCDFIVYPYFDEQKLAVNFEVKVGEDKQIIAVINEINKSITTSFTVHRNSENLNGICNKLINDRLSLLETLFKTSSKHLQDKLNNIKFIPSVNVTWQEFKEFYENSNKFKEFLRENINNQVPLDYYNKITEWSKESSENFKYIIFNTNRIKELLKSGFAKEIEGWSGEKFENVKFLINHSSELSRLVDIGIKAEYIEKWVEEEFENVSFLVDVEMHPYISNLADLKVERNQMEKWIDGKFENIKFLLEEVNNIKSLSQYQENFQELKNILDNELVSDYIKLVIKNPEQMISLANSGLGVKNLKEIYDKDNKLVKTIIDNSDKIIPFLKNKELTFEDLKKCKAEDIQNLAKGTISAEQLKASLANRTTLAEPKILPPPIGKWTALHQEKSQAPKDNTRTQK